MEGRFFKDNLSILGDVGIGTVAPQRPFTLYKASSPVIQLVNSTTGTAAADGMLLIQSGVDSYIENGEAGKMFFRTSATTRVTIDSSGNVGIGTDNPDSGLTIAKNQTPAHTYTTSHLHLATPTTSNNGGATTISFATSTSDNFGWSLSAIRETTNGYDTRFAFKSHNNSDSGSEVLSVLADGNVGIATVNPTGKLQIGGNYTIDSNFGGDDIYIKNTANRTSYDPNIYNTDDIGALITISDSDTVGPTKPGLVLHNDDVTAGGFSPMLLFSKRETGSSPFKAAMAGIYARSPLGTGDSNSWIDGELIFATAGAASNGIKQRMVINKEGLVGIGIVTPSQKLHVSGNSLVTGYTYINDTNRYFTAGGSGVRLQTAYGYIQFGPDNASWAHIFTDRPHFYFSKGIVVDTGSIQSYDENLSLNASATSAANILFKSSGTEYMRMTSAGKVGIGTTNPSTDFSVKEHLLFNDTTRLLTISNNTNTGGINLAGGNSRLYFSGYRALEGDNSGSVLYVGEGYGTTRISSVLNVVDHETILSPDQGSSGGVASRALTIENINDANWTADALTAYNATTIYDIRDRASYSFFARPTQSNILTFASETVNSSTTNRFVNLNSSATDPLHRWDFYQYDGSGTGTGDFKVPDKLFQIRVREGVSNVDKFTIKGDGNVGIGTPTPDVKLKVIASPADGIIADFVNGTNAGGTTAAIKLSNADSEACDVVLGANRVNANFGSDFFISLSDNVDGTNQERFRITEAGSVGIGTTSPTSLLHLQSASSPTLQVIDTTNNVTAKIYSQNLNAHVGTTSNHDFSIDSNNTSRIYVEAAGNVGIGTASPASKLQIVSSTSGDSVLKVDGTNGTLFEVVDDLSDSLMSVNDAAGLPVFEVFADNTIVGGRYNKNDFYLQGSSGKIGIGTDTPDATALTIQDLEGSVLSGANGVFTLKNYAGVVTHRFSSQYIPLFGSQAYATYWLYNPVNSSTAFYVRADNSLGPRLQLNNSSGSNSIYLSTYAGIPTAFNVGQENIDFNVRGDSDINLFYADASTDRIGIGTNAPAQLLHVHGVTQLGAAGKTEGGAVINYASFGETKSSASTILGNAIVPGTANSTVQRSKVDVGNFVRIKYNTGICFHTNVTSTINTNTAETTNERVRIDLTGNLLISDGLVGAPSLSFINDTNTGMWRAGVDNLRLVTGGSDAIVINSSQAIQLPDYGSGNNTGTRAYFLAVDSAGNIIEDSGGGGGTIGDGTITLAAGTGLTGGGSFTTNQAANATITFNATGGGGGGGTVTEVTVNTGLSVTNGTTTPDISLVLTDLPDMTDAWVTADDYFVVLDNNSAQKKKVSSSIFGANAFNSTNFITASSTSTLTNKSGNISQWTNDANYGTVTGTGTDGYISRWNDTSEIQNSNVFQGANGNVGIGTTTNINTKLLVEGDATVDGDLSAGGSAAANRTLTLNSVAQAGRPAAKINNPNLDTATASDGRTFHGWLPIDLDGTVKYIPVYN